MAKPARSAKSTRINPADIPLSVRLKAWWEGYDTDALYALIAETQKLPEKKQPAKSNSAAQPSAKVVLPPAKISRWSEQRAAANQLVWGSGLVEPPVPLELKALMRKLDAKPSHNLVTIGAGLGGFNRQLAELTKSQIDGYDVRGDIVDLGNQWSKRNFVEKSPALMMLEPGRDQPFLRRYDRLLLTQTLGRLPAMPAFFTSLSKSLRPGSKFVIYDWFRASSISRTDLQQKVQPLTDSHFVTLHDSAETAKLLGSNGFSVTENSLMTAESVEALTRPWRLVADALTELLHDMDRRDLADELLAEAELWTSRVMLAQEGVIETRLLTGVYTGKAER
jgi:2-polyprenyl-3-methyl-5-hydroxy-6-metoxy-1,4-benzoquinol methylase